MSPYRIGILITLVVALLVVAELTGLRARLSLDGIRAITAAAGAWGMLLFVAIFCAAQFAHLPGVPFLAGAVLSWGPMWGGLVGWVGAVTAVTVSFVVVRSVGGRAPDKVDRPRLQKVLAMLDARPIRTVFVLRIFIWMGAWLTYALALSRVKLRDFLIGSAVGLAFPAVVVALFTDRLVAWLIT